MFEHYIEDQHNLMPYLKEYSTKFPILKLPTIGVSGYGWDESRIKHNVSKWLNEIQICAEEIHYSYCFSTAYYDLINKYQENMDSYQFLRAYDLLNFELSFWLRNLLELLFSFREKIAHLVLDLYDQKLSYSKNGKQLVLNHEEVRFFDTKKALEKFQDLVKWIPSDDHNKITSIFKSLCHEEVEKLFKIRHAFTHKAKPPIDTTGTGPLINNWEQIGENELTVFFVKDEEYSFKQIESLFLKSWDRMRESILSIAELECFK